MQVVFGSVDPAEDRPESIRRYLTLFDMPVSGLTGSEAQLRRAAKAYGVYWPKVPLDRGSGYIIDHTATVFLMGANGEFKGTLDMREPEASKRAKLRRFAAS
jgi:protein SCO1/2